MNGWINRLMDGWADEQMDGRMDTWTNVQMGGWMRGWKDPCIIIISQHFFMTKKIPD